MGIFQEDIVKSRFIQIKIYSNIVKLRFMQILLNQDYFLNFEIQLYLYTLISNSERVSV